MTSPGAFADRVNAALGETVHDRGGPLVADLVDGLSVELAATDALLQPTARGWAAGLDAGVSPFPGWLGRAAGIPVPLDLTTADQRAAIAAWEFPRRGTIATICDAVWPLLTGTKAVGVTERADTGVDLFEVRVYDSETTLTAAEIKAVVLAAKPVGLLVEVYLIPDNYDVPTRFYRPGGVRTTYARRTIQYPTYTDRSGAFVTYDDATRQRLVQRTNLLRDPSNEGATLRWINRIGTVSGPSLTSTFARSGTKSMQFTTAVATGASIRTSDTERAANAGLVQAGGVYTFSVYIRPTAAGRTGQARVEFFTSAGIFITGIGSAFVPLAVGDWTRVSVTVTAPANSVLFNVAVEVSGHTSGEIYYIDDALFETGSALGAYFDGDSPDTDTLEFGWRGTPYASASVQKNAGP